MESYASLAQGGEMDDHAVLIRVVEPTTSKWSHIPNLDIFFTRVYNYHQKQGFATILVSKFFKLFNFMFILFVMILMWNCVDYTFLFKWDIHKTEPFHVFCPLNECLSNLPSLLLFIVISAALVWVLLLFKTFNELSHTWYIKQFYNLALGISSKELSNLTWNEVLEKVRAAQLKEKMCINTKELSQLDIYHRILREENYFIALVNKRILPPRLKIPLMGEIVYWTPGLRFVMSMIMFCGPFSFFKNPYELKDEYKRIHARDDLSKRFERVVFWTAVICIILCPIMLACEMVQAFLTYFEVLKRDPRSLGVRKWSLYGRQYLRHFNELDHELKTRLNRAYRPATRYLLAFNSPIVGVIANNLTFLFGSISAILTVISLIDGELLIIEVFYIALFGCLYTICRSLTPDETLAWCPEQLLSNVVECIHYLPPDWQGLAHTTAVRNEFEQLFHLSASSIIQSALSPIVTPYVLMYHIAPLSKFIVDFFRQFTISVSGVGDICSFALMDIKKHGNIQWQNGSRIRDPPNQCTQAEDGKTELSLIHFTHTNPNWLPPKEVTDFVTTVKDETDNLSASRVELSLLPSQFGQYPPQNSLSESWYGSRSKMEGPGDPNCMGVSALYLHDVRHKNNRDSCQTPAQESTPLLHHHHHQQH